MIISNDENEDNAQIVRETGTSKIFSYSYLLLFNIVFLDFRVCLIYIRKNRSNGEPLKC